jgi:hypothetical protein
VPSWLPGTTPAQPGDLGDPDPRLVEALTTADEAAVRDLVPGVRLIVPVVAVPPAGQEPGGEELGGDAAGGEVDGGEAEMAVPVLVNSGGGRALPVFSGIAALAAWRTEARPVPMAGARVLAAAAAEGYDGVVIDVAGPHAMTLRPPFG